MRLDKYLKVSRLIKRRELAKEFIQKGFIFLNENKAKPASDVKINDIIKIISPLGKVFIVKVKDIKPYIKANEVDSLYEVIDGANKAEI